MSNINEFTFSQDPEYIITQALKLFGSNDKSIIANVLELFIGTEKRIHSHACLLFSTENEKFINCLAERYKIDYYDLNGSEYEYMYIFCRDREKFGFDNTQPLPIYGVMPFNVFSNNRNYENFNGLILEDFLGVRFGIECHYNDKVILQYAIKLDNYKGVK